MNIKEIVMTDPVASASWLSGAAPVMSQDVKDKLCQVMAVQRRINTRQNKLIKLIQQYKESMKIEASFKADEDDISYEKALSQIQIENSILRSKLVTCFNNGDDIEGVLESFMPGTNHDIIGSFKESRYYEYVFVLLQQEIKEDAYAYASLIEELFELRKKNKGEP